MEYFSKIITMENLYTAHNNARKDKNYYSEVKMVDANPEYYLRQIQDMLINHTYNLNIDDYTVSEIIDKNKTRELWKLSYFPHRIIQWAIMLQIEPVFMNYFTDFSCASIKNRGIHYALDKTKSIVQKQENSQYCLKVDIQKYYHSINQDILKNKLRFLFDDKELLYYLDLIIDSRPPKGIPIGSYLSQFLANFYLTELDYWLYNKNKNIVRYIDDIVIFSDSKEELHLIREKMQDYLKNNLHLTLKNNYTVFPSEKGVDFIGYVIYPSKIRLRKTTAQNLKKKMRKIARKKHINYTDFCCFNSYKGWLSYCTDKGLEYMYLTPLNKKIYLYYLEEVKHGR